MVNKRVNKAPQIKQPPRLTGELSALNPVLQSIKESIEINEGQRGNPLDRGVKVRDLIDAGISDFVLRKRTSGDYATITNPNDQTINISKPPKPKNLQAASTTANVYLTWDNPNYSNHAYTEIWRSAEDNLATAVDLGARPSFVTYADPVESGVTYYYWIRFVSKADMKSEFNLAAGTEATSELPVQHILDQLSERITSSELVQDLREPIELIPFLEEGLAQEVQDRQLNISNEIQNRNQAIVDEAEQRAAEIQTEAQNRADAIHAESEKRLNDFRVLQSIVRPEISDVREIRILSEISNEEMQRVQQYQELTSSFLTLSGNTYAEIARLDESVTTESEARASSITSLRAEFENTMGQVQQAAVDEAINLVTTDDDVIAEVITKISASDSSNWATTQYVDQTVVTPLNALTSRTETLEGQFQGISSEYVSQASFTSFQQSNTSEQEALSEKINSVDSQVTNSSTGLSSKASTTQLTQTKNDIYNSQVSQFGQIAAKFNQTSEDVDSKASKTELSEALVSAHEARQNELTRTVTTLERTNFASQVEQIKSIDQSIKADRAQQLRLDQIESEYKTGLSTASASIEETKRVITDETQALSETIAIHKAEYETDKQTTIATKTELTQALSNEEEARVTSLETLEAEIKGDINTRATKSELNETIATEQEARVTSQSLLEASFQSGINARATRTELIEAIANEEQARVSQVNQLNTELGAQSATLQTQSESINGLKTKWGVKFSIGSDGQQRVSGFQMNGTAQSTQAHFDVDQFSISKPGADALDFAVADVVQPNGTTKRMVVMDAAKIVNLQVTDAMIDNVSADKLTAGRINASLSLMSAQVFSGQLRLGSGGRWQRYNENGGMSGYKAVLDGNGNFYTEGVFYVGSPSDYIFWDGATLNIKGNVTIDGYLASNGVVRVVTGEVQTSVPLSGYSKRVHIGTVYRPQGAKTWAIHGVVSINNITNTGTAKDLGARIEFGNSHIVYNAIAGSWGISITLPASQSGFTSSAVDIYVTLSGMHTSGTVSISGSGFAITETV